DRLTAAIGPMPSNTRIGSTTNVTTAHAAPANAPMMRPRMPARSSMARMMIDTVALTMAHGNNTGMRFADSANASPRVIDWPLSRRSAANTSAALKKMVTHASARYIRKSTTNETGLKPLLLVRLAFNAQTGAANKASVKSDAMPDSSGSTINFLSSASTRQDDFASSSELWNL